MPVDRSVARYGAEENHPPSASHLLGVAIARYVVRAEPIARLDRATLVAVSAPVVQGLLTGPLGSPA